MNTSRRRRTRAFRRRVERLLPPLLQFHRLAFAMAWGQPLVTRTFASLPVRMDVLYGRGVVAPPKLIIPTDLGA